MNTFTKTYSRSSLNKTIFGSIFFILFLMLPFVLKAADVYIQVPASGSATNGSGLTGNGGYSGSTVTWNITELNNVFTYSYTVSATDSQSTGIHYLILQTGNSVTANEVSNLPAGFVSPQTFNADSGFLSLLPASTYGIGSSTIAFPATYTLSFNSTQAPMWGNIFFSTDETHKSGGDTFPSGWNSNFLTAPSAGLGSYVGWVPIPGDLTAPEPATILSLCSGMGMILFARRQSVNRKGASV